MSYMRGDPYIYAGSGDEHETEEVLMIYSAGQHCGLPMRKAQALALMLVAEMDPLEMQLALEEAFQHVGNFGADGVSKMADLPTGMEILDKMMKAIDAQKKRSTRNEEGPGEKS